MLYLEISQGSYSLTEVIDIDPMELGTLFGNIGGFWGEHKRCLGPSSCRARQYHHYLAT